MRPQVIVIGASAGGVGALRNLVSQLPADFPASVLIAQHVSATSRGYMGQILNRSGPLPAKLAQDKERIRPGHIYVAPPNHHLLVKPGYLRVTLGPKENRFRPAIDPLFRSAAAAYGPQVIGVVMTGFLDDGTAGLLAIKRCNGLTMVQDPADADYPDMPRNAMARVAVDYVVSLAEMGTLLCQLVQEPVRERVETPRDILVEVQIAEQTMREIPTEEELGKLIPVSCPECQGPLWEVEEDRLRRYRCHVGHAYTSQSLLADQGEAIERTLWTALRAVEEHLELLFRLRQAEQKDGLTEKGEQYQQQIDMLQMQVQQLRDLLHDSNQLGVIDLPGPDLDALEDNLP